MTPEEKERMFSALERLEGRAEHLDDCIDGLKKDVGGLRVDYATHNAATSVRLKHLEERMDRREQLSEQTGQHERIDAKAEARETRAHERVTARTEIQEAHAGARWSITTLLAIGFGLVSTGFAIASLFSHH